MVSNLEDINNIQDKNLSLKQPSKEFFELIEEFAKSFNKPKEIFKNIVELGRNEGFTDYEIDLLVTSYIKRRVNRKTLYNYRQEFLQLEDKESNQDNGEMGKNPPIDDKKVIEESSNNDKPKSKDEKEEPKEITDLRKKTIEKKEKELKSRIKELEEEKYQIQTLNKSSSQAYEGRIKQLEKRLSSPTNTIIQEQKKNYRLTLYYAGKDVSVIIIGNIEKIITENSYTQYDLMKLHDDL